MWNLSSHPPGDSPRSRDATQLAGGETMTTKKEMHEITRREFLSATAAVGGAMVLGFWLPPENAQAAVAGVPADQVMRPEPWYRDAVVPEINAWLTVGPDDTVT